MNLRESIGKVQTLGERIRRQHWLVLGFLLGCAASARAQVTFAGTQFGISPGVWSAPQSVALDGARNLYVADTGNNRVVELSLTANGYGAPATILSGLSAPGGVAADWNGNVFVADTGNNRIVLLPVTKGGFGTAAVVAQGLSSPSGLAVDLADNLYIANTGGNDILELANLGGNYAAPMVIGSGFNQPMGVALDGSRNLFIADTGNNRVVKEALTSTGYGAPQSLWQNLNAPMGIAVDKSGDVYFAESAGRKLVEETWAAGANRFASTLTIGSGMSAPSAVIVGSLGQVFVTDAGSSQVLEVTATAVEFGAVGVGQPATPLTYNFNLAAGTALGSVSINTLGVGGKDFFDGGASTCAAQTYTAATVCGSSVAFTPEAPGIRMGAVVLSDDSGNSLATAFVSGVGEMPKAGFIPGITTQMGTQLSGPTGVAVDGNGDVYIADTGNNRVVEIPWTGSGYGSQQVVPVQGLINPMGLAVDGAGNLYIVSNGNDKVIELPWTPNGFGVQSKVGSGMYGPSSVATGANGDVYIADTLNNRIDMVAWTGSAFAQEAAVGNYHKAPTGIATDASGNLYYADPYENAVTKLPWGGNRFLNQVGVSLHGVAFPIAVAVDANSDLYVLDAVNNDLVMLPWNGSAYGPQLMVAGGFNGPSGMAIDGNGVVYVADTGNNQIVKIDMSAPGGMSYAETYLGSTSEDSPQATMIGNLGNEPVVLTGVSYAVDFPEGTANAGGCAAGVTLSASQWCELAVNFTPTVAGLTLNESATVTDNSLGVEGAQQSIALSGTSLAKSAQTISFSAPAGAVYGAAPTLLSATASSGLATSYTVLSGPGTLTSNGRAIVFTGAGNVVVQASQSGNSDFAPAQPVTVTVSVAPATLTVTPQNAAAVYGAIPSSFSYGIVGFVHGDTAFSAVAGQASIVNGAGRTAGVGSYPLTASIGTLSAANYVFSFASSTLTVNPAVLVVNVLSAAHVYGTPVPALQWSYSGFVNGDGPGAIAGAPELSVAVNSGTPVGKYPIVASAGTLLAANYTFRIAGGVFIVKPAVLSVTGVSQTITYGEPVPALSYSIAGFVNGDNAATALQGKPVLTSPAAPHAGAGSYVVAVAQGSLAAANYTFTFVPGLLQVAKAQIGVAAQAASMIYGENLPALTYSLSGFVNGDTAASAISGTPSLSTAASARALPGNYPISAGLGSLSAKNYSFALSDGTLSVGKALLTVMPKPAAMTYGGRVPALGWTYVGFVNGDTSSALQGAPQLTTEASSSSPAGSYLIAGAAGTLTSAKYTFSVQSAKLTVTPAVLTVAALGATMRYGAKMPALTYAVKGFVNGDTAIAVSGVPELQVPSTVGAAVGSYAITVTNGSLKAANYSFVFVSGQLVVSKALLTVTANSVKTIYGVPMPQPTYAVAGLVNGDTAGTALTGTPQMSTTAKADSGVGTYPIVAALGTLNAKNYDFAFNAGEVTIGKAPLTVVAANSSMTAGGALPGLTYTVKGLVNGDTQTTATSGKANLSTTASSASKAGTYPIVAGQGTLKASNYELSFVNGTLTVSQ